MAPYVSLHIMYCLTNLNCLLSSLSKNLNAIYIQAL